MRGTLTVDRFGRGRPTRRGGSAKGSDHVRRGVGRTHAFRQDDAGADRAVLQEGGFAPGLARARGRQRHDNVARGNDHQPPRGGFCGAQQAQDRAVEAAGEGGGRAKRRGQFTFFRQRHVLRQRAQPSAVAPGVRHLSKVRWTLLFAFGEPVTHRKESKLSPEPRHAEQLGQDALQGGAVAVDRQCPVHAAASLLIGGGIVGQVERGVDRFFGRSQKNFVKAVLIGLRWQRRGVGPTSGFDSIAVV
jgi:hypothetical protein